MITIIAVLAWLALGIAVISLSIFYWIARITLAVVAITIGIFTTAFRLLLTR